MTAVTATEASLSYSTDVLSRIRLGWAAYGVKCSWALVSSALGQIQSIGVMLAVARNLHGDDFGRYGLILSTLTTAVSLAGLSLAMTTTRCVASAARSEHNALAASLSVCRGVALVSGAIAAIVLTCFAGAISSAMRMPALESSLRFGGPYIFFLTQNAYQTGALAGFLAFREAMEINGIQLLIALPVTVGLTGNFGIKGAVMALTLSAFSTWAHTSYVLARIFERRDIVLKYSFELKDHHPVTAIALPASLASILGSIALWGFTVVSSMQPGGIAVVGAFTVATNFRLGILFVPVVLQKVLAAHLSRPEYRCNRAAYQRLYRRGLLLCVFLASGAGALIFVARTPLVGIFGRANRVDDLFLAVLLAAGVTESYGTAAYQCIATTASLNWQMLVMSLWCPVLVGSAWFAAHRGLGGLGMAGSLLLAWIVASFAYSIISRHLMEKLKDQPC